MRELEGPIVICPECGHENDIRDTKAWFCHNLAIDKIAKEHWVALAAFLSILFLPTTFAILAYTLPIFRSLPKPPFMILLGIVLPVLLMGGLFFLWSWATYKWFKSASLSWPMGRVYINMHLSIWMVLSGALYLPSYYFLSNNPRITLMRSLPCLLLPLGFFLIIRARKLIKNHKLTSA